jgi:hypothetical protein
MIFQHGVFSTAEEDYFVEPLWNHTNRIEQEGHPHVVYKRSSLKLPNSNTHCGVKGKLNVVSTLSVNIAKGIYDISFQNFILLS